MYSVGKTRHPRARMGGSLGRRMEMEKGGVAEPGKQKYWTPEASQSQGCLVAVNTRPPLYPTFPALLLSGRSEAALEGWVWSSCSLRRRPLTSLATGQEGQDRGLSSYLII